MPEATPAAVTPTPTTHPNAPQNGAAPPAAGEATATKPPDAGAVDWSQKYRALEAETNKRVKEHVIERRKWESDRKASAEKLARLDALEKREQSAKLNPTSFLRGIYGDEWQKVVNEAALTGATPAQLVQEEIQKIREEFEAKERARTESAAKEREESRNSQVEQARRGLFADAAAFYRAKGDEYPLLKKLGPETAVARTIANRIEAEFNRTHKVDEEGNVLERGKILTEAQAAELLEEEIIDWAREAGKHEKYKAKLQPSSTSTTVASSKQQGAQSQQPPRRSLTNDITGSTVATKPPANEKERRERVTAAFEKARLRHQG